MMIAFHQKNGNANTRWCLGVLLFSVIIVLGSSGCAGLVSGTNNSVPSGPPSTLSISGVQAASASITGFQVSWTTNLAASSDVDYGTTSAYGYSLPVNSTMVTSHQMALSGLTPGTTYHFRVRSTDASGASASSSDMTYATTADSTPPTVSITSPAANATVAGTVILSATASDSVGVASVQFKVDNANTGAAITTAPYNTTLNTTALSDGNHTITAVATDTVGNTATSAGILVKVSNAGAAIPAITSLSPTSGPVGTPVTIAGSNFGATQGTSTVTFNGTTATATSWSASSISTTVPSGASTGSVIVTVAGAGSNGVNFTVTAAVPSITSLNPASGAVGTPVTIAGANFGATQGTSTVTFNGTPATATNWSASSIKVTVPSGATSGNVLVTVGGVASNGVAFTVQADTTPPSVPTGLTATAVSSTQISLTWNASTDNVGVAGYNVSRGGTKIAASTTTNYLDSALTASTSYTYTVSAFDAAGNTSAQSTGASATTLASGSGGSLPTSLGWYQIPNTLLQSVCPPNNYGGSGYNFSDNCPAVVAAWSGGIADTSRNRLIVWGGGHSDYSGNEIYALDLNALTLTRLNNPAVPIASSCVEALSGPSPNSRHSYDDIAYIANTDQMFVVTGSMAPTGCASSGTWTLNLSNLAWTQQSPAGVAPNYQGGLAAVSYDPNTNNVFVHTEAYGQFLSYNYSTNTYKLLNSSAATDYHETSIIDSSRKLFFIFGAGQAYKIDISGKDTSYSMKSISASGCGFVSSAYPGLAFDSSQNLVVGWSGGNTVYLYNPDTDSCTSATYPNGPGAQQANGTYKRFSYFPGLNVLALVNSATQNAYVLRLTSGTGTGGGGGTGSGSGPNISGVSVGSITTTGATVTWTTDVAATTQVEYGTTTAYGNLTTLNSTLVTGHSQVLTGLSMGTLYHYRVHSKNSSGIESVSGDAAFSTNNTTDTTPPAVSMTAPANNATVSGVVTVSATASDNVAVASVQFTLNGSNLGSGVTASPYQASWDTTTVANGTYTLSAVATDTSGNSATAASVTVSVSNISTTGITDAVPFAQRCAAAGVFECMGFDSASDFVTSGGFPTQTVYPDGNNSFANIGQDCTVAASGGCSLKITIPGPSNPGATDATKFEWDFVKNNQQFGQNTTFYVQFRTRMDQSAITENFGGEGWKQILIYGGETSCSNLGLVTQNVWYYEFPTMFQNCSTGLYSTSGSTTYLEQGDTSTSGYNCAYGATSAGTCAEYHANEWDTYYYEIHIGIWGQANSIVKSWIAYGTGPLQEWINQPNLTLNYQTAPSDVLDKVAFTAYITDRLTTDVAASDGHMWFDDLIISSQPIPAPNGPTPAP